MEFPPTPLFFSISIASIATIFSVVFIATIQFYKVMKTKITILFCILHFAFCINLRAVDNISLNGVLHRVDTTAVYPIGPSTKYIAMTMTRADGKLLYVYQTIVDRTNEYISFEAHVGRDSILGGEVISKVAKRHSSPGHHLFTGHNGDFYVTQGDVGLPTAACVVNDQLAYTPNNGRPVAAYAEDGTPYAGQFVFNGTATHDGVKLNINHVNYNRLENELVLYNRLQGKYTRVNAYGTEVVVVLADGEKWGVNREIKVVATENRYRMAGAAIPANGAVLSGHGVMATALESVAVGDTIVLSLNTTMNGEAVAIANCVGGDTRKLMLKDGKIETAEVWDELHPRTGWGFSQTGDTVIYCVVDGRSVSIGCTTKVLAEIMQSAGAYTAINLDGGGSSSIYIDPFGPVNNCSDGTERAVSNGMFVVNNAPEDNTIAAISANIGHVKLPAYGTYIPHVLGYNQYGALVDTDVEGFELSCKPEVGHIEDGQFVASGTEDGYLTITYNGATTQVNILKNNDAKIALRLDSVLIDDKFEYAIEVQSIIGLNTQLVQPKALTWTVDNPAICSVEEGILRGLMNGETFVIGQLGDAKDTLKVIVETVEESLDLMLLNEEEIADWSVKAASSSWKTTLLPATDEENAKLTFTYSGTRAPYVQMTAGMRIYSLPKKIAFTFNPNIAKFSDVIIEIKANNAATATSVKFANIEQNKEQTLVVDVEKEFGKDIAIFPLVLSYIKFNINTSIEKTNHVVDVKSLQLIYDEDFVVEVDDVLSLKDLMVYPNPAKDYIVIEGVAGDVVCIYDLEGRMVKKCTMHDAQCTINTSMFSSGTYIVRQGSASCKIVIK